MDSTDLGTPITSSYWDNVNLGIDQGTLDGNLNFLGALDTNTNVTSLITGGNNSLESSSLTGLGLLLDGEDAHDLIRELGLLVGEESINDGGFLDGDGVSVNLLEGSDVAVLHESTELGEGSPLLSSTAATEASGSATTATGTTSAASASVTTGSAAATTTTETSITTAGSGGVRNCRST